MVERYFQLIKWRNNKGPRIDRFREVYEEFKLDEKRLLKHGVLYLVQNEDGSGYDCARFLCPCGCGNEIRAPSHTKEKPGWHITHNTGKGGVTLGNVNGDVVGGYSFTGDGLCPSHYFVQHSKILWL